MGKLLSLLSRDDSTCCSPQKYDVFLDFENAQPTNEEIHVYEKVQQVLRQSESILADLQCYKGAGKEIREAIANPSEEECQLRAWQAVVSLVENLKRFYLFSVELESLVIQILAELCSDGNSPTQHLEMQQALVKQFAEILEFVWKFDEHKMKTPAIQNDLAYYKRSLTKYRNMHDMDSEASSQRLLLDSNLVSRMSFFYGEPTPMLRVLSDATSRFVTENPQIPIEQTTEMLSTMAKVCLRMLEKPNLIAQFQREETQLFVLRVMVGLVILFDHVHPNGAFVKTANVDVKGCVKLLKDQPAVRSESLLDALRLYCSAPSEGHLVSCESYGHNSSAYSVIMVLSDGLNKETNSSDLGNGHPDEQKEVWSVKLVRKDRRKSLWGLSFQEIARQPSYRNESVYTTKHFNDEDTPKSIRNMLAP